MPSYVQPENPRAFQLFKLADSGNLKNNYQCEKDTAALL